MKLFLEVLYLYFYIKIRKIDFIINYLHSNILFYIIWKIQSKEFQKFKMSKIKKKYLPEHEFNDSPVGT